MARVAKKKVSKKRVAKKRVAKKNITRRVKKKVAIAARAPKTKYWVVVKYPNNTVRYYDGIGLTPNNGQKAYFDNLKQATKVARKLATKVNHPIAVHSNKTEKKK